MFVSGLGVPCCSSHECFRHILSGSKPAPTSSSSSKSQPSSSKAGPAASGSASAASKTPQRVYILLPSSTTAILQLYNTDAFFNKKTFQPVTAETIQSASKPQYVDVKKTKADGTPIVFRFIDATSQLRLEDWENVVGVVAQGQKYQFVHYRWREPTEVFQNGRLLRRGGLSGKPSHSFLAALQSVDSISNTKTRR